MLQLIHDPTRVSEFTNSTIDLIFTSHPELVSESGVLPVLISDHYLVYGVHYWKAPKREGRSINFRFFFKDIDNDDFRDDIINAPLEHVLNCHDVNDAWSIWHSTFMSIINHHAPMKCKRIRGNSLPWLDGEIIQLMRQRDRAHKIAKCSGSQNNWDVYKKLRNSVTDQIRCKKSEHFISTIEENKGNSSVMWKKLKDVLPSKQKIVPSSLLSQHGEVVDDLADIAAIFNEHFSTVGERLVNNATPRRSVDENIHLTPINSLEGKCTLPDITEEYVQKEISSMSVGKATGPDGISVQMLQIASRYITKSLTHIFNISIRCEHYPKEWKYALVTPIHKGGDKCNTTNYRPISILPIISKILERWVHSVVYSYLDECNLIPCCQSGFRPQHSTETTLHDLTNTCYQAMERGEMTGTVFYRSQQSL